MNSINPTEVLNFINSGENLDLTYKELTTSEFWNIVFENRYLFYISALILILLFIRIYFINKKYKENKILKNKQMAKCIVLYLIIFIINLIGLIHNIQNDVDNYIRGYSLAVMDYTYRICFIISFILIFIEFIIDKIIQKVEKSKLNVHKSN